MTCRDSHATTFPWSTRQLPNFREGEAGYGDTLRSFIPEHVVATAEAFEAGLRVEFPNGAITLRPTYDELVGPDIATLAGFVDKAWMCWRPGEDAFEYLP
ncbi:hypothetical protein [Nocardia sp. NPDC059239]|uniref:hypothetical protein n=1 Tax=Nocardia sp. NPDC059239 TaxID=3346785 RepID=UPI0036AC2386